MKKDYRFHYKHKGKWHEYHVMADSYKEAREFFDQYVSFLKAMGLDDVEEIAQGSQRKY